MKEEDIYFRYSRKGKVLGVSKSEQSASKMFRGADKVERVEVRPSEDFKKELEVNYIGGQIKGFFVASIIAGGAYLVVKGYKKVRKLFKKREK